MSLLISCIIDSHVDANPKQDAEPDVSFQRPCERRRRLFAFRFLLPMTTRASASRSFPVSRAINCSKAKGLWRRQQRPIYNGQPLYQEFSFLKIRKRENEGKKGT